ncbi:MAG: SRPBCC family protein [Microthrixaceae bacterium]|nr:SRPBCC family protein [Microthrixaceae bacterium]
MPRRSRKSAASPTEVSITIEAPADRLYDIVSDVTKMGRISPECTGGKWLGKAKGPAVDARFKGTNRRGPVFWSTTNRVIEANRGREFSFETQQSGARWRYRFEPASEGGTVVTESHEMFRRRPAVAWVFSTLLLGGAKDHDEEMHAGMRTSLERLKAAAENPAPERRRRFRRSRR